MADGKRILVTGGAGMIGSNLVKELIKREHQVTVVDNLWRGKIEYLLDAQGKEVIDLKTSFHELDLSIPGVLDDLIKDVDYVFHLADIVAGIGYVFSNQGYIFRKNMLINSNVIESVSKSSIKGYVYVGTACSFPAELQTGVDAPPLREEDQYPAAPESAYGWSKLMGEYEALLMEAEANIPVSILSLHNVYGAPCDFDEEKSQVIPSLIRKVITSSSTDALEVWGSGNQGRAFVHVDDVVNALITTMTRGLGAGVIQIGPDVCVSISEIAHTIVDISGKSLDIIFDLDRPEGDGGRCADYSKARSVLNWEPRVSLKEGLTDLYQWIEARVN